MSFSETMSAYQERINQELDALTQKGPCFQHTLFEAMRYSLLDGGKRIRPILTLEFARLCGVSQEVAMPYACAIEMIHTSSLIHDDLPCMDDDALRRGRPTNHIVYGEAIAVLAGDALLNYAFETVLNAPELCQDAAQVLARAVGASGMMGGQVIDLEGETRDLSLEELGELHRLKTGALIRAAVEMGCALGGADNARRSGAIAYAEALGLAFQMKDDILDVEGDAAVLGKATGVDALCHKTTYVSLLGIDRAKEMLAELTERAEQALSVFPEHEFLSELTRALAVRNH